MKGLAGTYLKFITGAAVLVHILNLGCKKNYSPAVITAPNNYLVVKAVINTGTDSTIIRLSRTVPISSAAKVIPETGAVITIVSDANVTYPVVEESDGYYKGAIINSNAPVKYSLKIFTKDGKSYQSDFVPFKNSPPIDSVYFKIAGDGIGIYADTHDPAGNSRYYRWDYTDTYIFNSAFESVAYHSKVPSDTVLFRPVGDEIYQCWKSDTSKNILTSTSAKLTADVISDNLIISIPSNSEKIAHRYSIQVTQYALTPEAYNYYQQLSKNTEKIGTIFDPQPSELPGNVHCISNPSEPVIGYITAGAPSSTRVFIDNRQLPAWRADNPYSGCILASALYKNPVFNKNEVQAYIYTDIDMPVEPIYVMGTIVGWTAGSPSCVDCTLRGTNKRPLWWTDN